MLSHQSSCRSHLVQVGVAPRLSIGEDPGHDPPLAVVLPLLCGGTPLEAGHLTSTGWTDTHTNTDIDCVCLIHLFFS